MADGASPTLSPKEAIALGMKYFTDLMEGQPTTRVLLEGLNFDQYAGNWIVTFGFDSERVKPLGTPPFLQGLGGIAALTRTPEMEILREFRAVHLSASDGHFVKLEHA